ELGDRALLRAFHFFDETERVEKQIAALESGDTDAFLSLVRESGRSSYCYLQNVYSPASVNEQSISFALYLSERFLKDAKAAWRIQGGGFAGTIEAFVPTELAPSYKEYMEYYFGAGSCKILSVRPAGAVKII
ncbi:MAG: galactokinase, partial [Clostridia bacterium]|nr:galactokinase [Clostridia bacterium]